MCYRFVHHHRNDREKANVRQDITFILERIQEELLKGFLVVPLRDENGVWSAAIIRDRDGVSVTDGGCPQGSYLTNSGCGKYYKSCLLWLFIRFYRTMLAQSAVMRLRVVCPSVCLSVTFRYRDQIRLE